MSAHGRGLYEMAPADAHDGVNVRSVLEVLRRRRWLFLAFAVLVPLAFATVALLLPSRYRAEALLAADPVATPGQLDPSSPELSVERQLGAVRAILFRRSLLERIIRDFQLFPDEGHVPEQQLEEVWARVRIRVEGERIFSLGFEDENKDRSLGVTTRLAAHLVDASSEDRRRNAADASALLASQIESAKARLDEHGRALQTYQERFIEEVPEQVPTMLKLLEGAQARLQGISATVTEEEARRVAIQRELQELDRQGLSAKPTSKPADTRLSDLRMSLRQLRRRYTEEHPDVARTRLELEELERGMADGTAGRAAPSDYSPLHLRYLQLRGELSGVEERLARSRTEEQTLLLKSAALERHIEAAPRHELAMTSMKQELQATRTQHQALLTRLQNVGFGATPGGAPGGSVFRVIEAPRAPVAPVAPRRLRISLMGILFGLVLGMAAAFLAEQADGTFRKAEELAVVTELPVLASIPTTVAPAGSPHGRGRVRDAGVAMRDDPEGFAAEQYRILATKLSQHGSPFSPKAVLVTSPLGSEGKTTTAVNISLALARMMPGQVLLVDADLGRPAVHRLLQLDIGDGLRRLLQNPDDDPLEHVRRHQDLCILEAGGFSRTTRATLASPEATQVFRRLRERFRFVVVDAPPVLAVAESLVLQHMVDGCLLVVRARKTSREMVRRAVDSLDRTRLWGAVLTDVEPESAYVYPYAPAPPSRQKDGARC